MCASSNLPARLSTLNPMTQCGATAPAQSTTQRSRGACRRWPSPASSGGLKPLLRQMKPLLPYSGTFTQRNQNMELVSIGTSLYACLQPDRGLGWSNSGFIATGGAMVVDTLYDQKLTA